MRGLDERPVSRRIGRAASALAGALLACVLAVPALGAPDGVVLRDVVVSNTDPALAEFDAIADPETSIAVNPANPRDIVISAARSAWGPDGAPAPLFFSHDAGQSWTEGMGVPAPAGVAGTVSCPCNQTVAFGRGDTIYGTFLVSDFAASLANIVSGSTRDPTNAAAWLWSGSPGPLTNQVTGAADQPQVAVGPDPLQPTLDRVYVAYDDLAAPNAQVAVSDPISPTGPPAALSFPADVMAGSESPGAANPGLRIAADQRTGAVYILYERSTGVGQPKQVTYMLNRSVDGGKTWGLNGQPDGIALHAIPVPSQQGIGYKFGGVNAILGGVDALGIDPVRGDVYVVYGADAGGKGGNQLFIVRVSDDGTGRVTVGPAAAVGAAPLAALPAVAVTTGGTVGVLYDSFEGTDPGSGLPTFAVHLAQSADGGLTFTDQVLETFVSPAGDNGDPRQRVLGDYQQIQSAGNALVGAFPGNGADFGRTTSNIDPIFFTTVASDLALTVSGAPAQIQPGSPIPYSLTVTNRGPGVATNVRVASPLPSGVAVPASSASQGTCTASGSSVSCAIGTLPVGASASLAITAVPSVSGAMTATASAFSDQIDPTPVDAQASAATTVGSATDLSVTTGALPTPAAPGRPVTYTFAVTNNGTSTASGVSLHDELPPGVTLVDANASQGDCVPVDGGVRCDLGTIPGGSNATVTVTLLASRPGTLTNTVRVTTDVAGGALPSVAPGAAPNLSVAIRRAGSSKRSLAGGVVSYRLLVSNLGAGPAANVRVESPLPRGARLVSTRATQGACSLASGLVECSLGALPRGDRAGVLIQLRPSLGGRLVASGRVTGAGSDPQPNDDLARLTMSVTPAADLGISVAPA
ncbi:MAG: hypothetical protein QOK40_2618, partial [Miltoncostaeaceae bacterium]|nr:hypothetical protein [Miltoncostaeaceae bacterium]